MNLEVLKIKTTYHMLKSDYQIAKSSQIKILTISTHSCHYYWISVIMNKLIWLVL